MGVLEDCDYWFHRLFFFMVGTQTAVRGIKDDYPLPNAVQVHQPGRCNEKRQDCHGAGWADLASGYLDRFRGLLRG